MSRGEEEGKRITFGSVDCTVPPRVGQGAFFLSKIVRHVDAVLYKSVKCRTKV